MHVPVAGIGLPVCPREARLSVTVTPAGGHLSNAVGPYRWYVGTDACPWKLTARSGQKIYLRAIVMHSETTTPMKTDDTVSCSAVYVIKVEVPLCSALWGVTSVSWSHSFYPVGLKLISVLQTKFLTTFSFYWQRFS